MAREDVEPPIVCAVCEASDPEHPRQLTLFPSKA